MSEGWFCPKCGTVNAPTVPVCPCSPWRLSESSSLTSSVPWRTMVEVVICPQLEISTTDALVSVIAGD